MNFKSVIGRRNWERKLIFSNEIKSIENPDTVLLFTLTMHSIGWMASAISRSCGSPCHQRQCKQSYSRWRVKNFPAKDALADKIHRELHAARVSRGREAGRKSERETPPNFSRDQSFAAAEVGRSDWSFARARLSWHLLIATQMPAIRITRDEGARVEKREIMAGKTWFAFLAISMW